MSERVLDLCRAAVERCIARHGLDGEDAEPTRRRIWLISQRVTDGLSLAPLPDGFQYDVEAATEASDPDGGWTALATVLLNCQETINESAAPYP